MNKQDFITAGFNVIDGTNNENPLPDFIKQHYPQIIRDGEVKLDELKSVLGLPVDEKVNGYGLNFVGRNVAKGKYRKETDKALKINTHFSRDFDKTQNLVLKGDNLDCLKILKSHYSGQIKCIYIDPPYNTDSDNFIYPDKFDREEAEALGLANLSDNDMDRLEFSFRTKKSHNGWLTFMYPRLMLARELMTDDGVIFVSIDDNEQANLKLLMDDVFGEENLVANFIVIRAEGGGLAKQAVIGHDYLLVYAKNLSCFKPLGKPKDIRGQTLMKNNEEYWIETDWLRKEFGKYGTCYYEEIEKYYSKEKKDEIDECIKKGHYVLIEKDKGHIVGRYRKVADDTSKFYTILKHLNKKGSYDLQELELKEYFEFPKPVSLVKDLVFGATNSNKSALVLDFFAGSGTTAQAVMQLNAEDGGSRKFILCQIDEPIKEDTPAYKFCIENSLPPVISSITCERIKRAGDKIRKEIEEKAQKPDLFKEDKQATLDIGFKVFDLTDAPKLELANSVIRLFDDTELTPLDRIYNLIFKVGIDNPAFVPIETVKNCMYRHGDNYYIANSAELDKPENRELFKTALQNGQVYIDGWTATLNTALQETKGKEDRGKISIVF